MYGSFTTVLRLYFAFFVIQWVRMVVIFIGLCTKNQNLGRLFDGLGCSQCCYGLACLIILHVYRFQPASRIASNDYMDSSEHANVRAEYIKQWDKAGEMPESGQYFRGQYLLGLVIYVWVGGFIMCCVQCCASIYHVKKYGPAPQ